MFAMFTVKFMKIITLSSVALFAIHSTIDAFGGNDWILKRLQLLQYVFQQMYVFQQTAATASALGEDEDPDDFDDVHIVSRFNSKGSESSSSSLR